MKNVEETKKPYQEADESTTPKRQLFGYLSLLHCSAAENIKKWY